MTEKTTKKDLAKQIADQNKLIEDLQRQKTELEKVSAMNTQVAIDPAHVGTAAANYMDQVQNIMKTATVNTNKIQVQEFTDHKNISLWTPEGKRIGPMHQTNALNTLRTFYAIGIFLSTDQPTAEQIEAYKKTDEYRVRKEKFDAGRAVKEQSRKKGSMDKYIKEIAKMSGQTIEAINSLLSPENVKSIGEAQAGMGIGQTQSGVDVSVNGKG